jgi:Methyltransferase domain
VRSSSAPGLVLALPILAQMRAVEGWLEEAEADLLIATATRALLTLPPPVALVEIGSYCGRSTVVLGGVAKALGVGGPVHAIDPHEGLFSGGDETRPVPTLDRLRANLTAAGVAETVNVIAKRSCDVAWAEPIGLLFVDGLHDYASVAADFRHYAAFVMRDGPSTSRRHPDHG